MSSLLLCLDRRPAWMAAAISADAASTASASAASASSAASLLPRPDLLSGILSAAQRRSLPH